MLEYFSCNFDESIINKRGKKKKRTRNRAFLRSISRLRIIFGISIIPPTMKAREEAGKRVILPRMHLEERTHARNGGCVVAATALSHNRASFSVPRSFLPCRKTCDILRTRTFYCVICAVFSGTLLPSESSREAVRIILIAAHYSRRAAQVNQ